jgi:hypothetical protein
VPWSSTAEAPPKEEALPARTPVPVPVPEDSPRRPIPTKRLEPEDRREPELLPRRRQREFRRANPRYCLHHDDVAAEHTCDACRLRFCPSCVVKVQDQTLCGPCKNFRVAALGRPARVYALAIVALVVALVSAPVAFLLTIMAIGLHASDGAAGAAILFCLVALVLPAGGLALGGLALREIERNPQVGGRALATTGASTALVGVLWSLTVITLVAFKQ